MTFLRSKNNCRIAIVIADYEFKRLLITLLSQNKELNSYTRHG